MKTRTIKTIIPLILILIISSCSKPETVYLDQIDLSEMTAGWGSPRINKSITDGPILINETEYERGVGTHATSTFLLNLHGSALEFTAKVGVDDASTEKGSIQFFLIGDKKVLWQSEVMKKGMDAVDCEVSLKGIHKLGLLVTGAGDGIAYDHANWAEAMFTYKRTAPEPVTRIEEEEVILTPAAPDKPRINGPLISGMRQHSPFLYRIPVTGKRPMAFSSLHLPDGIRLDAKTGILSGMAPSGGDYKIQLTATNDYGSDEMEFTIRVGDTLALTPPMGWNSWYIHYHRVSDKIMREAADQMIASGMADYGYQYVNIDDCWMVKVDTDDPEIGGPVRDKNGKLLANKRFPDMHAMTDYIHDKGLKAGIYISPGPKTCAGYAGSYNHEALDAHTFADWGFDFLKYDWCSYGRVEPPTSRADYVKPYKLMWTELKKQNRDIVLNLCQYGMDNVWEWGGEVGNCWRTTGDLGLSSDGSMPGLYVVGRSNAEHWQYARPGNWNDPDYILIGWVGNAFKMGEGVKTSLSPNEQYFYMSMWSLMASPLIFSGDMAKLDPFTLNVLCNHEVIAVNQDPLGRQGKIIREEKNNMIMVKLLQDGSLAVGLFQVSGKVTNPVDNFDWDAKKGTEISLSWAEIGVSGPQSVRDLWRQRDLGVFEDGISLKVPWHGVQMLRISSIDEK
ncbi:MAG: NPCBM/NEW2 domain-containing protein [Bacteroidales bacterium]|nr:NPCBM/NEW2 domain-containing protein [Bacteroidales bacterium]